MNTPAVRQVEKGQAATIGSAISLAFFEDPLVKYLVPEEEKRLAAGKWFFASTIEYCRRWGEAYTDEGLTGGGAWLTPGNTNMTTARAMRAGFWQLPFRVGLSGMAKFNKIESATSKVHKRHAPGNHWYLLLLGVHPESQKTGIGSALIEAGAVQAQEAGLPVYLETMTERNVEYYLKRGFKIAEEFDIDGQVRTWAMVRAPE